MFYNSKGGSGKSTLATNLAAYYAQSGLDVHLVDMDPQESSMQWINARPLSKPRISSTKKFNKLQKKKRDSVVIYDLPASLYGSRLENYVKKADVIIVPVMPSPIDMRAAKEFISSLRKMGPIVRKRVKIGLVANRCRANTNIFLELDDYLVKERGIKYITAFRDNTNYIKAAKSGVGIFEMGESLTAQDREEWKPLIRWINSK